MTAASLQRDPSGLIGQTLGSSLVRITTDQYHLMIQQGIVPEGSAIELLHGLMVQKDRSVLGEDPMGHSPIHHVVVALLSALASRVNSDRCHIQIQLSISCPPDSEPEPDAAIIRGAPRDYKTRLPGPQDVSCVIEAAHSSLDRDREDKLPIYARAAIPQYIIINLQNNAIEVHTDPDPAAQQYRTKSTIQASETLELNLPEGKLRVQASELLP